jgi:hypothetical protein
MSVSYQDATVDGMIGICYAASSLSRFCSCPRKGHMLLPIRIWSYFKKYPNQSIGIDFSSFHIPGGKSSNVFYFENQYGYAKQEIDPRFPKPIGEE